MSSNTFISQQKSKIRKDLARAPKDFLFRNLPVVPYKNNYLIFSPHNKKIIKISKKQLKDKRFENYLEKNGYFEKLNKQDSQKKTAKLTLILTSDCNLRCKYCYAFCGEKKKDIAKKFAFRSINEVIKSTTDKIIISFFGGEPTLCFSLIKEIVEFIKKKNIEYEFHISTNTVKVTDEMIDYFIDNKFIMGISIDGPPLFQDKLRVFPGDKPTSHLVENVIKKLVAKKAYFTVRPTIVNLNVKAMPDIVNYFASLGVKFIHFELVDPYGRALDNKIKFPKINDYVENFGKAIKKAQKYKIYIINSSFINLLSPTNYYCSGCKGETFIFTPDEYVTSCYEIQEGSHKYQEFIIGKYNKKTDAFDYDKNKIKNLKNISADYYEECKSCSVKYICGSGCPFKNFRFRESFKKIDPYLCEIRKRIIREAIISIYNASLKKEIPVVFGINAYENQNINNFGRDPFLLSL